MAERKDAFSLARTILLVALCFLLREGVLVVMMLLDYIVEWRIYYQNKRILFRLDWSMLLIYTPNGRNGKTA